VEHAHIYLSTYREYDTVTATVFQLLLTAHNNQDLPDFVFQFVDMENMSWRLTLREEQMEELFTFPESVIRRLAMENVHPEGTMHFECIRDNTNVSWTWGGNCQQSTFNF